MEGLGNMSDEILGAVSTSQGISGAYMYELSSQAVLPTPSPQITINLPINTEKDIHHASW